MNTGRPAPTGRDRPEQRWLADRPGTRIDLADHLPSAQGTRAGADLPAAEALKPLSPTEWKYHDRGLDCGGATPVTCGQAPVAEPALHKAGWWRDGESSSTPFSLKRHPDLDWARQQAWLSLRSRHSSTILPTSRARPRSWRAAGAGGWGWGWGWGLGLVLGRAWGVNRTAQPCRGTLQCGTAGARLPKPCSCMHVNLSRRAGCSPTRKRSGSSVSRGRTSSWPTAGTTGWGGDGGEGPASGSLNPHAVHGAQCGTWRPLPGMPTVAGGDDSAVGGRPPQSSSPRRSS